ncbi:MAG: hypothetical protein WA063_03940 [Minisyncoccia bacterium]
MSFVILVSFLLTFIFVRTYVRLGQIGILDDPNLYIKGYHIHHLNYGIVILAITGLLALFFLNTKNRLKIGVLYGIGLALTFDEFGMWLKLEEDYYSRLSYDAMIIITIILLSMVYLPSFWHRAIYQIQRGAKKFDKFKQRGNRN